MCWLLSIHDKDGNDLYPEIRRRTLAKNSTGEKHNDMVRFDYVNKLGYYCSESSEHNAEYNPFYIKRAYPELIQRYNIPLDEYPRRCVGQIRSWKDDFANITAESLRDHTRSNEYASHIMEAIAGGKTISIGGNVLNRGGLISNLPQEACVEVPCLVNRGGVQPCYVGELPVQCAAMNMTNINVQLLTIEAARTRKRDHIYQAAMLDPHTAAELSIDDIRAMVDELIEAHGDYLPKYH
jgi:alpha-galactosidase